MTHISGNPNLYSNHKFQFGFRSQVLFLIVNYPLITPIGLNFMHFLLRPAASHVLTTSVTFLYDSGASSITSFGEATRMAMPRVFMLSRTSPYFNWLRDLARDKARPCNKNKKFSCDAKGLSSFTHSSMTGRSECFVHCLFSSR